MSGKRKKSGLSAEDRDLWMKVARTLTPLDPQKKAAFDAELLAAELSHPPASIGSKPETATAINAPKTERPTTALPLHKLEHRYRKKLVRGVAPIDARIDLHGLTQHQAHDRLRGFLYEAQRRGHKVVLVITGKGGQGFMDERGILRRVVPQWLTMPDLRPVIVGYEEAHAVHGGAGALYVRVRRKR